MVLTDSSVRLDVTSDVKFLSEELSNKINDFQVIVLYNQANNYEYKDSPNFPSPKVKDGDLNKEIFPLIESQTFIVWQKSYEENKDLFFKLRLNARNELFLRLAEYLITKYLSEYKHQTVSSLGNQPKLKWDLVKKLFNEFENTLKNDTFLAEENVWEEFTKWFRTYLMDSTIKDMVKTTDYDKLLEMDRDQLNTVFFQKMNTKLTENTDFIHEFTRVINSYVKDWMSKITSEVEGEKTSGEKVLGILNFNGNLKEDNHFKTLAKPDNIFVMSNAVYQTVRESISNKLFVSYQNTQWPKARLNNRSIKGNVQLIPYATNYHDRIENKSRIKKTWEQAELLSELDVDVYDTLCSFCLSKARHHKDFVEIYLDDFLAIRGLKPKLGGSGRRGGYELKQRNQILKSLSFIRNLWINIEEVIVYEKGKPVQKSLQGRAFIFKDINYNDCEFENPPLKSKFLVKIGAAFEKFLYGSGRQVKLLPVRALEYDPYREVWEKKLTRYLSWRWRTQARKGSYLQPHKISTLLEKLGVKLNKRTPSRVRDRLEKALDVLEEDSVISSWQYGEWDESISLKNGWLRIWKNSTIIISPPEEIIEHYQPLERTQSKDKDYYRQKRDNESQQNMNDMSKQVKELRIKLGLTLQQVADEVEISVSYLSNIERGIKIPSTNIMDRIINWMGVYNFN